MDVAVKSPEAAYIDPEGFGGGMGSAVIDIAAKKVAAELAEYVSNSLANFPCSTFLIWDKENGAEISVALDALGGASGQPHLKISLTDLVDDVLVDHRKGDLDEDTIEEVSNIVASLRQCADALERRALHLRGE